MARLLTLFSFTALLFPAALFAADPFATESLVKPRAGLFAQPCGDQSFDKPLTVADVVDLALCRNPKTAQAWANARLSAEQVGVARSPYLPKLDANVSADRNWSSAGFNPNPYNQTSAGLTASYLLFDFSGRGALLESAKQSVIAADATLESTTQTVFLNAASAFYQVEATQGALDAAVSAEQAAQESFKAATARYEVGAGTPADKLQAQTAYSQATLNRIRAEGDLRNAHGTLANVIGLDADRPLQFLFANEATPKTFEANVRKLIEAARQRRPDLASAEAQIRAAEANVSSARSAGRPTLSLSASTGRSDRQSFGNTDSSSIGVTLSVPLFAGFAPTYRVRAAEAQVQSASAQRDQIQLQIALDVWTAYQNLQTAMQSLRTTDDLLASATQSQQVALGRYKAGVGSILDVLNAQSSLASARQQRIQAIYSWNVARVTLAQAMGSLDQNALTPSPGTSSSGPAISEPKNETPR